MFSPARWFSLLSVVTANKFCIRTANGTCPSSSKRKYTVSLIDMHTAYEIYKRNTSPLTKRELIQIEIAFVRF